MTLDGRPLPVYGCKSCATLGSFKGDASRMPKTCPTRTHPDLAKDAEPYRGEEHQATMQAADATPFTPDGRKRNRVEELVEFAKRRAMKRIGVAFCVSLIKESQQLARMLQAEGLDSELVCCRVGAIDYDEIGLQKAHPDRFASICNPVAQARLLNEREVDLVVQVGLCLGHDLILQAECGAPVTTLVVKDRALEHNPLQALRPAQAGS